MLFILKEFSIQKLRCQKMFSSFIIDKMHKICSANICNAHRELTANYNQTSSEEASLVVFVSSGFHSQRKTQIKVCFTYFVHFALLIIKHLLTPESYTEIKCALAAHSRARADASHNLPLREVRILAFCCIGIPTEFPIQ